MRWTKREFLEVSLNHSVTESFNEQFCVTLEFHLSSIFGESDDKLIRSLWCDGVLMPYFKWQFTKKHVNDTRKIETKAWIGRGGQEHWLFELTIYFGKYSLRRYAKGRNLKDCLPEARNIIVDFENKYIELFMR